MSRMTSVLINIDVPELEAAASFYTEAFGLQVGRRFGDGAVELLGAEAPVYLLKKAAGSTWSADPAAVENPRRYDRHWTPVHLDFVVEHLEEALERARGAGALAEGEIREFDWGRIALVEDPYGNGLCILEFRGGGYSELL
jgi:predicted enzyme related to lactoylglutathione lyase